MRYPLFFGQITAALEGIALVLPVEQSMTRRDKFPLVLRLSLAILTIVLMSVGVLGSLTFGDHTSSIILLNFGASPLVTAVKIMVVVGILFTYPVQIVPVLEAIDAQLVEVFHDTIPTAMTPLSSSPTSPPPFEIGDDDNDDDGDAEAYALENDGVDHVHSLSTWFVTSKSRVLARMVVVLFTAVIAQFAADSFGLVQSLVGSVGASVLAYTAPALIANHVETEKWPRFKNWAVVAFGVVGGVVGTVVSVMDIVQKSDEVAVRLGLLRAR